MSTAAVAGNVRESCGPACSCTRRGGRSAGYLGVLTFVAWGIQIPMLLFAVPKFAERLTEFGVQTPEITRLVLNWSQWMGAEQFATTLTGAMVYGAAIGLLSIVAFAVARLGGRLGKALVVMLALAGGAIACGQAAAVIVPALQAQRAIEAAP